MKPFKALAFGSNVGNRKEHILHAARQLEESGVRILKASSLHETEPVNCEGGLFLNQVVQIETLLDPGECLVLCQKIEREIEPVRQGSSVARKIDIDILLWDNEEIATQDLIVPHPRMYARAFVMEPLSEILDKDGKMTQS